MNPHWGFDRFQRVLLNENRQRRLSKGYERGESSSEAFIHLYST